MGCLSHISESRRSSEEDIEMIQIGKICGRQLMDVINDVLDYSKVSVKVTCDEV